MEERRPKMASISVDVTCGPVLRTALDVLDLAAQLYDKLPPGPERDELEQRMESLADICEWILREGTL